MIYGPARMTARFLTTALLAGGLFGFAIPAKAGFEFKPGPSAPVASAQTPAPDAGMGQAPAATPALSVDMTPLPGNAPDPNVHSYPMGSSPVATPQGSDIASMPVGNANAPWPPAQSAPTGAPGGLNYGHAPAVTDDMVPPPGGTDNNRQPMNLPETSQLLPMGQQPAMSASSAGPQGIQSGYAVIKGFGKDMPLALAMHEIVPTGYAYSFDSGINPGMRISWQGGRAWNEVLADAVAPYGLRPVITGQSVRIAAAHTADMAESAPAPTAQPELSGITPAPTGFAPMPAGQVAQPVTAQAGTAAEPPQSYPHRVPHKHLNSWQPDSASAAPSTGSQDPGPPPVERTVPAVMPNAQASPNTGSSMAEGQGDLPPPPSMDESTQAQPMASTLPPPVKTPAGSGQDAMTQPPDTTPAPPSFYTAPQTQPGQTVSAADMGQ